MKNIMRELENYDEIDDFVTIERFDRKPSFKDESYRKERRGDSIQRKRREKAREKEQMIKNMSDDDE